MNESKTYLVGGAVRDSFLGIASNDKDFVVVGETEQRMLDMGFKHVGMSFPVFLHPVSGDEYALARVERKMGNGYQGFEVDANPNVTIEDDLSRRDLTINAMAIYVPHYLSDTEVLVDPFGGKSDLENKILRHVSPAFAEDPLRVIRLARFAARFSDFTIHPSTHKLACDLVKSGELNHLSSERFWAEMTKVFESNGDVYKFFRTLFEFGVFKHVTFFNKIWGNIDNFTLTSRFNRVLENSQKIKAATDRLQCFVAITAVRHYAELDKADSDTKLMYSYVQEYRTLNNSDAYRIFMMCNRIGAYSNSKNMFNDFVRIVSVMIKSGEMPTVQISVLINVLCKSAVTAADFPDEAPGPNLGVKIKAARINQIQSWLNDIFGAK